MASEAWCVDFDIFSWRFLLVFFVCFVFREVSLLAEHDECSGLLVVICLQISL